VNVECYPSIVFLIRVFDVCKDGVGITTHPFFSIGLIDPSLD
jgi:hypothetical protein